MEKIGWSKEEIGDREREKERRMLGRRCLPRLHHVLLCVRVTEWNHVLQLALCARAGRLIDAEKRKKRIKVVNRKMVRRLESLSLHRRVAASTWWRGHYTTGVNPTSDHGGGGCCLGGGSRVGWWQGEGVCGVAGDDGGSEITNKSTLSLSPWSNLLDYYF